MGTLKNFPIWIAFPISLGGAGMSAFLAAIIPIWAPAVLGWASVGLFVFGCSAAVLHWFAGDLTWNTGLFTKPASRIPILSLREWARKKGWPLEQGTPTGRNEAYSFVKKLQQAGVDGEIKFWGRPFRYVGMAPDTQPLLSIPPEFFDDHLVESASFLSQETNLYTQTTKLGKMRDQLVGELYDDLHIDARQARKWLGKNKRQPPKRPV